MRGKQDDLDARVLSHDPLRRLGAVQMRHVEVHHDDIRAQLLRRTDRLPSVLRFTDDLEVGLACHLVREQAPHGVVSSAIRILMLGIMCLDTTS